MTATTPRPRSQYVVKRLLTGAVDAEPRGATRIEWELFYGKEEGENIPRTDAQHGAWLIEQAQQLGIEPPVSVRQVFLSNDGGPLD